MPEDGFLDAAGPPVMQQEFVPIDRAEEPETPQRGRPPFTFRSFAIRSPIGKPLAHVVQEKIGVGMDSLSGDFRKDIGPESSREGLTVADGASDRVK